MFDDCWGVVAPHRKDMSDMSFVGIHNTNEGLIAFADSKASRRYNDGRIEDDLERGNIQKVFSNNLFICVTHGNNELFSEYKKTKMEDYCIKHIVSDVGYMEFFDNLFKELLKNQPEYNDGIYHFIIGSKDENGYFTRTVLIDLPNVKLKYSDKNYKKDVIFGGNELYIQLYNAIPKYYDIPVHEYINMIESQLLALIQISDSLPSYNSVGPPFQIKVFQ